MTRFSSAALLLAVGLCCLSPVNAAEPLMDPRIGPAAPPAALSKDADPVVAKVEGEEIRLSEVADAFARVPLQYQKLPRATLYSAVLDNLINTKLAAAAARKQKLDQLPEVKEEVARIEAEILHRVYLNKAIDDQLTDDAVQKRYQDMAKNLQGEKQVHARQILVDSEAKAKDIINQLNRNADFAELARKYSSGPSAQNGGDVGDFTRGQMVKEFADAAFALNDGEYTKAPVKTEFGWHVIKVESHSSAPPPTFAELRPKIESDMAQEIGAKAMDNLRQTSKIERFEIDPKSLDAMLQ
jgi:peptidyl-prolyl cis-trans isomerase C